MNDRFGLHGPRSRRDVFRLAGLAAAGSAALLAACGDDEQEDDGGAGTATTDGDAEADVAALNSLLELEHLAVAAYTAAVELLDGEALALGRRVLEHERRHVDGIRAAIQDLGGTPAPARSSAEYEEVLPALRGAEDGFRLGIDVESTAIAAYIDALPKLSRGELRGTAAAILTSEAEHASVLLGQVGEQQAPSAFVTGQGPPIGGSSR